MSNTPNNSSNSSNKTDDKQITLPSRAWKAALRFVSKEEGRYAFDHVLAQPSKNRLVTTDGKFLAVIGSDDNPIVDPVEDKNEGERMIIDSGDVKQALKMKGEHVRANGCMEAIDWDGRTIGGLPRRNQDHLRYPEVDDVFKAFEEREEARALTVLRESSRATDKQNAAYKNLRSCHKNLKPRQSITLGVDLLWRLVSALRDVKADYVTLEVDGPDLSSHFRAGFHTGNQYRVDFYGAIMPIVVDPASD